MKIWTSLTLLCLVAWATALPIPTIRMTPVGLQFSVPDKGYSLVAFHFSINQPLPGTAGGQYDVDVRSAIDNKFTHTQPNVNLQAGDTVSYWVYAILDGRGQQILDQTWTYGTPTSTTPAPPAPTTSSAPPTATTAAPSGSSAPPGSPSPGPSPRRGPGIQDGFVDDSGCQTFPCLIFEDNFDFLNHRVWEHEITAGGGGNWEFQFYTNNRSNSYTRDGVLYIKPTLTSDHYSEAFLTSGTLNLWGGSPGDKCTGNAFYGCERRGFQGSVLNPIQSARLRSSRGFNFRYGKVEVEAQLPVGDWLWPAIWMMPRLHAYGPWPASGEIDIMESRGNVDYKRPGGESVGVDTVGCTMHFGTDFFTNQWSRAHATKRLSGGTFGDAFHKYSVEWTDTDMAFMVDGEEVLRVDPGPSGFWNFGGFDQRQGYDNPWQGASRMAPFDQEFYLILNVAVGGTTYFSDSYVNRPHPKPWSDSRGHSATDFWAARGQWYPTWNPTRNNGEGAALKVNYVKVWKTKPDP